LGNALADQGETEGHGVEPDHPTIEMEMVLMSFGQHKPTEGANPGKQSGQGQRAQPGGCKCLASNGENRSKTVNPKAPK